MIFVSTFSFLGQTRREATSFNYSNGSPCFGRIIVQMNTKYIYRLFHLFRSVRRLLVYYKTIQSDKVDNWPHVLNIFTQLSFWLVAIDGGGTEVCGFTDYVYICFSPMKMVSTCTQWLNLNSFVQMVSVNFWELDAVSVHIIQSFLILPNDLMI